MGARCGFSLVFWCFSLIYLTPGAGLMCFVRVFFSPFVQDFRVVVRIDSWESTSVYPNGHFVRVLGRIGDLEGEIATILVENNISVAPFSEAQVRFRREPVSGERHFVLFLFASVVVGFIIKREKKSWHCHSSLSKAHIMKNSHSSLVYVWTRVKSAWSAELVSCSFTALKFLHFPTVLKNGMSYLTVSTHPSPATARVPSYRPTGLCSLSQSLTEACGGCGEQLVGLHTSLVQGKK